ncbi:Crp/Fnr family transcriptional regulator [Skermanella pratensis]|uniref:Crp/Fnr family transcriptional regulator n=1 Tax=Skermanella pratensis TaxID=2233999 RepID=UPI0013019163|nr:Crp/Fnr family transcriptional regulator [Skermanella pratensis]
MSMATDWLHALPALDTLDDAARGTLARQAALVQMKAGTVLFRPGDACANFLIVLEGSVRVHLLSELGREIVLYRVGSGSTCILTTSCLIGNEDYSAEGVTETAVSAVALPKAAFDTLITRSGVFRDFVFRSFGARLTDLMRLVSEVAFGRIECRLAEALINHAPAGGAVPLTHQALATELGTAREVVSRQLKEFEHRGLVGLGRGRLEVLDPDGLRYLAAAAPG